MPVTRRTRRLAASRAALLAAGSAALGLALLFTSFQESAKASSQDDGEAAISTQSGIFSDGQADKGEELFQQACMVCHQPEEFSEGGYMESWAGQNVGDMFDLIRATMPEDNPGRLKRREYAEILAYFFRMNGLPAGEEDLTVERLQSIVIEGPFGEASN